MIWVNRRPVRFCHAITIVFGVALLLTVAGLRTAVADVVAEETFWQLLIDARAAENDATLDLLADRLATIDEVRLASGVVVAVDTGYLVENLRELDEAARNDLLDATLAARSFEPQQRDGVVARERLSEVLARPEFQESSASWIDELLWRLQRWLWRQGSGSGGSLIVWLAAAVATVVLLFVLRYWLRGLSAQFSAEDALPPQHEELWPLTVDDALQQAQQTAASGDYRTAVRLLYLAALLSLDERDLLRFDRSKTNREYLRSVGNTEIGSYLGDVVDVFDQVWYGFQPIDADGYQQYRRDVQRLVE